MRATYLTAILIALLIGAWLLSGQLGSEPPVEHPTLAEANRERAASILDGSPITVRARVSHAQPQWEHVVLRGRTENKRTVQVKAETAGRIVERPVERGAQVRAGDLLCRISLEDREVGLQEARAALVQAQIENEASLKLRERGFQSETAIAQAAARLAAAEAQVERRTLDLARTRITAPFAGVVEDVHVELGDYATTGSGCVTLVDMNPMLLVGRVSERQVARLQLDQTVTGTLSDGRTIEGPLTFIGHTSDPTTRTYAVEAEIANPSHDLRSGITTELRVPVAEVMAHKVSPALFALDDEGNIGVRIVNERNEVEYRRVTIVSDAPDGAWVTGLPEVATLITVGQELVVPGQRVALSFEPAATLPARAPEAAAPPASSAAGPAAVPAPTSGLPAATAAAKS
jgi:membrane fusion protein, multidrug efflux system